jgi:hypothetical protein
VRTLSALLKLPPNHAYPSSLVLYCFHRRHSSQLRIVSLCPFVDHRDGDASLWLCHQHTVRRRPPLASSRDVSRFRQTGLISIEGDNGLLCAYMRYRWRCRAVSWPATRFQISSTYIYTLELILQERLRARRLLADPDRRSNILVLMLTVLPSLHVGCYESRRVSPILTGD